MLRKQICLLVHYMAVVITKYPLVTQEAKNEELPSWARGISWVDPELVDLLDWQTAWGRKQIISIVLQKQYYAIIMFPGT